MADPAQGNGPSTRAPRRDVHGVLLLDKPVGLTSNDALQRVKRLFAANKAGHTGSLDPLASGMLPVCFGEATKVSGFLLDADKYYVVTCRLGERTATADAEGEVVETKPVPALDEATLSRALAKFRGEILQVPPMYSALRHQGQRLYDLAREGVEVPREPRPVTIHELILKGWSTDSLTLEVRCSKGTYIRTLVEDVAAALGTCGHVTILRRLAVGPFTLEAAMVSLAELEALGTGATLDRLLLPVDSALRHWPEARLSGDAAWYFTKGQPVFVAGAPTAGQLRVYADDRFLGVGEIQSDGRLAPRRLMNLPASPMDGARGRTA
ncbi:MAG TPA: tRNA pseudouridine(55) synthase TruB [Gammaproteobacteria bacterium]|nr:tRNA pseudouridine(55) synthase TruB [Gammaproteobacteria bacterium]